MMQQRISTIQGTLWIIMALVVWPLLSHAARIELTGGSVIIGDIISLRDGLYTIRLAGGGELKLRVQDIVSIENGGNQPKTVSKPDLVVEKPTSPDAPLRFHGSNTVGAKLIPSLASAFYSQFGSVKLLTRAPLQQEVIVTNAQGIEQKKADIQALGTDYAITGLRQGTADFGMASHQLKESGITEHVIALDGLAVIIHPSNPVTHLSLSQIAALFSGQIDNWSEVGGRQSLVTLYARDEHSGTYHTFVDLVLKNQPISPQAQRFASSEKLADNVANDPSAIGFIGQAYARLAKPVAIRECDLIYPLTTFAIKTEEYPLARRLYLYTRTGQMDSSMSDFLRYLFSQEGQKIVRKTDFIDLSIESEKATPDNAIISQSRFQNAINNQQSPEVLRDYTRTISNLQRLSITFRFETGSATLDSRALADLERLADYQKSLPQQQPIWLLGFSDERGDYKRNRQLSEQRAQAVAQQLNRLGVWVAATKGYGEEVPVACNNESGWNKNRRVEVWTGTGATR